MQIKRSSSSYKFKITIPSSAEISSDCASVSLLFKTCELPCNQSSCTSWFTQREQRFYATAEVLLKRVSTADFPGRAGAAVLSCAAMDLLQDSEQVTNKF